MSDEIIFEKDGSSMYYITVVEFAGYKAYTVFDYLGKLSKITFLPPRENKIVQFSKPSATVISYIRRSNIQFKDYFSGRRRNFNIQINPNPPFTEFQETVLTALKEIPYGELISYKDLAAKVGKPQAARAVAQVMASNPLPIYYPCHRVIKSNSELGEYALKELGNDGANLKKILIDLEKEALVRDEFQG